MILDYRQGRLGKSLNLVTLILALNQVTVKTYTSWIVFPKRFLRHTLALEVIQFLTGHLKRKLILCSCNYIWIISSRLTRKMCTNYPEIYSS